jgi:serine phosphatase RsbU (regulator of sigma subunit)
MAESKRILTIEDDPTIRANIVAYLEDSGYEMLEAADGLQGLEQFRENQPDLVLCDLRMPKMDGLDVLREITQTSSDTPVIVVSGAGMIGDAIQALKRGAWDYLTKPIPDMQILEVAVNKALDRSRLVRENRAYQAELEQLNQDLSDAVDQLKANQRAGREVQSKLLPLENQVLGDFVFRHRLFPAMHLSGDFVDYFFIDSDHVGFYMVDVSGHDAGSAFVTVIVRTLMSQMCDALKDGDETILMPNQTLQRLNDELFLQDLDKYITMFYGVIDLAGNRLVTSNGGHYPHPFLYDGSQLQQISTKGRPVGLFDEVRYINSEIRLPQDFLLLLMSDGIFELMPEKSTKACYEHLLSNVNSTDMSLEELIKVIGLGDAAQLLDDVAMLAITRRSTNVQ